MTPKLLKIEVSLIKHELHCLRCNSTWHATFLHKKPKRCPNKKCRSEEWNNPYMREPMYKDSYKDQLNRKGHAFFGGIQFYVIPGKLHGRKWKRINGFFCPTCFKKQSETFDKDCSYCRRTKNQHEELVKRCDNYG